MTILLIIAAAIFTVVAAYNLIAPFLASREDQLRAEVLEDDLRQVEELVARRANLLQSLRDIEFDHETGKLTDADFEHLQKRYERQAVRVMRELDDLHGGRGWESAIDEQLAERLAQIERRRQAEKAPAGPAAPAVAMIACPECGKDMESDARFCSQCGTTLNAADDEPASSDDGAAALESHAISNSGSEVAT